MSLESFITDDFIRNEFRPKEDGFLPNLERRLALNNFGGSLRDDEIEQALREMTELNKNVLEELQGLVEEEERRRKLFRLATIRNMLVLLEDLAGLPPERSVVERYRMKFTWTSWEEIDRRNEERLRIARLTVTDEIFGAFACGGLLDLVRMPIFAPLARSGLIAIASKFDHAYGVYRILAPLNAPLPPDAVPEIAAVHDQTQSRWLDSLTQDSTGFSLLDDELEAIAEEVREPGTFVSDYLVPSFVLAGAEFGAKVYRAIYPYPPPKEEI